ncbi:MAG: hypothetical protein QMC96_12235 [Methanomicrobiales archaeon]|nr:hypothetical protein [Methanomicrobiales archaeon]
MAKDEVTRFTVQLSAGDRKILQKLVDKGIFMSDSDALRTAIRTLGAQYGVTSIDDVPEEAKV